MGTKLYTPLLLIISCQAAELHSSNRRGKGCFEHGNEPSVSIRGGEFLEVMSWLIKHGK
jgi:hypothetical protein